MNHEASVVDAWESFLLGMGTGHRTCLQAGSVPGWVLSLRMNDGMAGLHVPVVVVVDADQLAKLTDLLLSSSTKTPGLGVSIITRKSGLFCMEQASVEGTYLLSYAHAGHVEAEADYKDNSLS